MVLGRLINKVGWGRGGGLTTRRKKEFHNKLCDSADQNTFFSGGGTCKWGPYKWRGWLVNGGHMAGGLICGGSYNRNFTVFVRGEDWHNPSLKKDRNQIVTIVY